MKKTRFLVVIAMLCLCNTGAMAQDWKSLLSGIAQTLVGDKATTATSIVGTWTYAGPACEFESDNLLAQAGGSVASSTVEEKLSTFYTKVGMAGSTLTFNQDGSYSAKFGKIPSSGTYTFDSEAKTVTMKTRLGVSVTAHVAVTGSSMNFLFEADRLLTALKTITNLTSSLSTSASLINTLAGNYEGLRLGFELTKSE